MFPSWGSNKIDYKPLMEVTSRNGNETLDIKINREESISSPNEKKKKLNNLYTHSCLFVQQ